MDRFANQDIRQNLHLGPPQNGKFNLLGASYYLMKEEKWVVCQCLTSVKMPTGFSSNIKSLVSMKDLSLINYNSHDYHVMLTVFVPIVIRAIGQEYVKM